MEVANNRKDMKGLRFGRLLVKSYAHTDGERKAHWYCVCDCGETGVFSGKSMRSGLTQSCGCLQREMASSANKTHGISKTRLYRIWGAMKRRVKNPRCRGYAFYGGRGIKLHSAWEKFEAFQDWALENGYRENLSIERVDVNGDYSPANCSWVSMKIQSKNRRTNVVYEGEIASDASRRLGGSKGLVSTRVRTYGWSLERAFTTPYRNV